VPFKADVVIDPMVSAYDAVHLWAMAGGQGLIRSEVPEVTKAFAGLSFDWPVGLQQIADERREQFTSRAASSSVRSTRKQGFDILWQSKDAPKTCSVQSL